MKQLFIVLLVLGFFSSGAQANEHGETGYVGVYYGVADSNDGDVENGNLGLVVGGSLESGPGIEFFYTDTVDKDEFEDDGLPDVRYSTQAWGLLGTYKFGSKFYAMLKAGYVFMDIRGDVAGSGTEKFDEDGLSYGFGAGIEVGDSGAVELNYLSLPDVELSVGNENIDFENEIISLGYYWRF
jgi:hypothetical protein